MKTMPHSRILIRSGLAVSLITGILYALVMAGSAVYLPFVTGFPEPEPVDAYEPEFADDIEPWKAVT